MNPIAESAPFNSPPLGWALLIVALAWAVRAAREKSVGSTLGWKWWALAAAALACFRWPLLWAPHQLNPDESQLVAFSCGLEPLPPIPPGVPSPVAQVLHRAMAREPSARFASAVAKSADRPAVSVVAR